MKYYCYIIYSESRDRYYIGHCSNLEPRLVRHNAGATPSTKSGRPWKLVYSEKFFSKSSAIIRENQVKSKKSRDYILKLIQKTQQN